MDHAPLLTLPVEIWSHIIAQIVCGVNSVDAASLLALQQTCKALRERDWLWRIALEGVFGLI